MTRVTLSALSLLLSSCAAEFARPGIGALTSPALRIAAVFAGGGNTGAPYARDYVVLVNAGETPASTAGLALVYAGATSASALGATDATRTPLSDRILAPGAALLIGGASGASGAALAVDVDDASPIALATSGGRLALVFSDASLGCNGGTLPCDEAALARIVDRIAWGSAPFAEGSAAPALGNADELARAAEGCVDRDDNALDFVRRPSAPRGAADPERPCLARDASVLDGGVAVVEDAAVVAEDGGVSPEPGALAPADVQGPGWRSPREGTDVRGLTGHVVFADGTRFAIERDGVGVFVRTKDALRLRSGTYVSVDGRVIEDRFAPSAFGITTVVADRVELRVQSATVAPPAELAALPMALRVVSDASGTTDVEAGPLEPLRFVVDAFEQREGARVRLASPRVVGPTRVRGDGRREVVLRVGDGPDDGFGASVAVEGALTAIALVETSDLRLPLLDAGDRLDGEVLAVVDFEFDRPILRLAAPVRGRREAPIARTRMPTEAGLSLATFNLRGLCGTQADTRFVEVAAQLVDALGAPDVLSLTELGDDSCEADDGIVASTEGERRLLDALGRRTVDYDGVALAPRDGDDGGEPGLNIRPALLVRRDRGLAIVREAGGGRPASPARWLEDDPVSAGTRKPLYVRVRAGRSLLEVVVLHLPSRRGDAPATARMLPPARPSSDRRLSLVDHLVDALARSPHRRGLVVLGDFNDVLDAPALAPFADAGLAPLEPLGPDATFVHVGVAASLDHILVTPDLVARGYDAEVIEGGAHRALGVSDHDAVVATLGAQRPAMACAAGSPRRVPWPARAALVLAVALIRSRRRMPGGAARP